MWALRLSWADLGHVVAHQEEGGPCQWHLVLSEEVRMLSSCLPLASFSICLLDRMLTYIQLYAPRPGAVSKHFHRLVGLGFVNEECPHPWETCPVSHRPKGKRVPHTLIRTMPIRHEHLGHRQSLTGDTQAVSVECLLSRCWDFTYIWLFHGVTHTLRLSFEQGRCVKAK